MGFEEYTAGTPREEFEKAIVPLSNGTKEIYRGYLQEFLDWREASHLDLFNWVRKLETAPDPRERKQLTNAFNDFSKKKLGEGRSMATVLNYRKAIHKFLDANELTIRIKKNGKKIKHVGQDIITRDQIRKLIELASANTRLKAILLTLKDSGLGVSEAAMLTADDYYAAREIKDNEGRRFKQWANSLLRLKTGEECRVCLGPEAITAIEDYLGNRRTGALFLTSKGIPHKDDAGRMDAKQGYTAKGAPLSPSAITTSVRHHCKVLNRKGYKVSAHSFRKLFETSFELEGRLNTAKMIMGKAIPASDEPYLKMGNNLLQSYAQVYVKHLLLDNESRELRELKEKQAQQNGDMLSMKQELNRVRVEKKELDKKLEEIYKLLKQSNE